MTIGKYGNHLKIKQCEDMRKLQVQIKKTWLGIVIKRRHVGVIWIGVGVIIAERQGGLGSSISVSHHTHGG